MKKTLLLSLGVAMSLNAALSDSEILSMYAGAPADVKISVAERLPVDGLKGIEAVILQISKDGFSQEEIIFTDNNVVFMDIVDPKNKLIYKEEIKGKRVIANLAKAYKNESKDNIITIGNDPAKPTVLVITDAECPYCRQELENIEENLKKQNIQIIMAGSIHGDRAHAKSALIYKEAKSAKTDAEKIAILRKYYAKDSKITTADVNPAELNAAKAVSEKYFNTVMGHVPYIIETSKLK